MKQPHQYRPLEQQPQHDACGIGAVVNISGQRTHETLDGALKIVEKLAHRTGKDADGTTGDGVGVMTQLPHALFQKAAQQAGQTLPDAGDYGAAMIFFPQDPLKRMRSRKLLEMILSREGLELLFWRDVPVCPEILSEKARSSMPYIAQCFIRRPDTAARGLDFDRRLYLARREYEHSVSGTYVVSMSSRTIVYKGLFLVWQLRQFYPDLQDADYTSALALVHSRFSTNTTPSWKRAHPNRIILHNGEINTIRGNINRMLAREETMASSILGDTIARAYPVVETDGSDSSMLDNTPAYGCRFHSVFNVGYVHRQNVHIRFPDKIFKRGCLDLSCVAVNHDGVVGRIDKVGKHVVSVFFHRAVRADFNVTIKARIFNGFQTFFGNFLLFFVRNVFFGNFKIDVFNKVFVQIIDDFFFHVVGFQH